ncbi:hypothetical protein [Microbulbifer celer]|uniref:Lipoprotein n=1 Tax=Microbulbifer celer TaxID=435905 RepID=A0ABW3U9G0_9GAMM|nr:hypothetical protein [Microbulbifer celer]UFN56326.1 hypothetical protein LPW13_12195 [Microbulbifer celer]
MRYFSVSRVFSALLLATLAGTGGCGYLPSEMEGVTKPKPEGKPAPASTTRQHTASCDTAAKNYRVVQFDELYDTTGDPRSPFRPAPNIPAQYDVNAYVWGYDNCMQQGNCSNGDHYWLIKRGPEGDFSTWVVTPQFPRITIASTCKGRLKVGKRYRFSFKNGALVGFSRN